MQTIPAQTGVAFRLQRGQRLEVVDPNGKQVSDLFCVSADDIREHYSSNRSMDYAEALLLSTGHVLYSNRSQPMLTILADSCGRHDLLMPPCSLKMFQIVAGNSDHHPSCHENLAIDLAKFDVSPDEIDTTFNIFMNVTFNEDGVVHILDPSSKAGSSIVFRAEMDLFVGLTACSHEETNGGLCKPILYIILNADEAEA